MPGPGTAFGLANPVLTDLPILPAFCDLAGVTGYDPGPGTASGFNSAYFPGKLHAGEDFLDGCDILL